MLIAIGLWQFWWGDSPAGSVFALMVAVVLVVFLFFFVKALFKLKKPPS
jgi:membrane protein YdbS with pleckstrin-like domain